MTMAAARDELDPPFEVLRPATCRAPILFNSPHSGSTYPKEFLARTRLDKSVLRRSEDSFVDEVVLGVVRHGYPLMRAYFPRCYVDVNREPYELDPRMFDGRLPSFANTRSMRVAGGLGTVARVVGDAQEIYEKRLPVDEALRRIETLYKPYHRTLRRLFMSLHSDFGAAVLVDCHSMPSAASHRDERPRPDFVLGDRYGTSCSPVITDMVEEALRGLGYTVRRNKPYAGGFITEHYGNPAAGLHTIQLEINRGIYMDERRFQRGEQFDRLAADFELLARRFGEIPLEDLYPYRTAAE
jgi:N-formylglutamate amidohydrolase